MKFSEEIIRAMLKALRHYDWRLVSQYIVVSSLLSDLWPDIAFCPKVDVLLLWGALSDDRSGLSFVSLSL
jgi:hypothetical protein